VTLWHWRVLDSDLSICQIDDYERRTQIPAVADAKQEAHKSVTVIRVVL
jgi:hypothetical protein